MSLEWASAQSFWMVSKGYFSDEGHRIANSETLQSKACCDLDGKYRWLASGTPINVS